MDHAWISEDGKWDAKNGNVVVIFGKGKRPIGQEVAQMKKLLNTLFVTEADAYASLANDNIVIKVGSNELGRYPLHLFEGICLFTYHGASPQLMGKCASLGISLEFFSPGTGHHLTGIRPSSLGNVTVRRKQYHINDSEEDSLRIAKRQIYGKLENEKRMIIDFLKNHSEDRNTFGLSSAVQVLESFQESIPDADTRERLSGIEGSAAVAYFSVFDSMIRSSEDDMHFSSRSRRPPKDNVNALLSFCYMLLENKCTAALESVGLDYQVGFLHSEKPGKPALSLNLMEELRPILADRFVLRLINLQVLDSSDFMLADDGGKVLTKEGMKKYFSVYRKLELTEIYHKDLGEKVEIGLLPFIQAKILANSIQDDCYYSPFIREVP